MIDALSFALCLVVGYLIGSFPTGYWVARSHGVDIQKAGSGNIGATNVLRAVGTVPALIVLIADPLKGMLAVLIADLFSLSEWGLVLAGLAAVLGNNFNVFLGLRGRQRHRHEFRRRHRHCARRRARSLSDWALHDGHRALRLARFGGGFSRCAPLFGHDALLYAATALLARLARRPRGHSAQGEHRPLGERQRAAYWGKGRGDQGEVLEPCLVSVLSLTS